ncbi:MAG TPA: UvrD-helicase domain-containing protein [Candidatus Paceibacterota bacterium]
MNEEELKEHYKKHFDERDEQTRAIVSLIDKGKRKVVVVAGPGTGKTTLFSKVLETKSGQTLTLSFVNALVNDLSLGLFGLSEVRTLHGFSTSFLKKKKIGATIFPKLSNVIREDAQVLTGESGIDFEKIFQEGEKDEEHLKFYKKRKDYYGNYYGYSDVVYALVKYFELEKHKKDIPTYDQIVVDEFQDFNQIEVALIDLLAEKSPILIAGDDDQSLYIDLKGAKPKHIRDRHSDKKLGYESPPLTYCSRSTEVIVSAVNDFVKRAIKEGLLKGRVKKSYQYFPCKEMDSHGKKHSQIIFQPAYAKFLSPFFKEEISALATIEKKKFEVLIIVPNALKKVRFPVIASALRKAGFKNINYSEATEKDLTYLDGFSLLIEEPESNLGWRVLAQLMTEKSDLESLLKETDTSPEKKVCEMVNKDCHEKVTRILGTLKKILADEPVEHELIQELLEVLGYDFAGVAVEKIKEVFYSKEFTSPEMRGVKDISITITTILGSKGLAADYVFLMDFSDKTFGKGKPTDQNAYDFIVAMTRARKRIYLVSPDDKEATFLHWIEKERVDKRSPFIRKLDE